MSQWIFKAVEVIISGLGKSEFMRSTSSRNYSGQRTCSVFLATHLITLCVLIHSLLFVIDCLNSRSSNTKD